MLPTESTMQQLLGSGHTEEEMYFLPRLTGGKPGPPSLAWVGPTGCCLQGQPTLGWDPKVGAASTPQEPSSPILWLRTS